jgi:hypothetical protein
VLQFLYDLVNSPYFGILLIIWVVIDLIWISRWKALLERIGKMITKPWIFARDDEPDVPPLYPRKTLEQLAQSSQGSSKADGEDQHAGTMTRWLNKQRSVVFDEEKPTRTFGHLLFLVFFVFFLIADAISVASTLAVMGLISATDLPPLFQRFDLAVLGGALLSAVVGIWIFVEISGDDSDFINTNRNATQRAFIRLASLVIAFFAVVVMIGFATERLIAIGLLPQSSPTVNIVLSAILYGLVPVNSAISAALSFPEAILGLIAIIFVIMIIFPVLIFIFDILYRLVYIILDIILWALFSPIIAIPFVFDNIGKAVNPPSRSSTPPQQPPQSPSKSPQSSPPTKK